MVLSEAIQAPWVCDSTADLLWNLPGRNDLLDQCLYLFAVDGHRNLLHTNHKSWNMLVAQFPSNCLLHIMCKLATEEVSGLHYHK